MKRSFTKRLNSVLALVLTIVALAVGQRAWAQTFTIEASHNNNTNKTTFTIKRSGSSLPQQTIKYRTVNLSAFAGVHYTAVSDSYTFPEGITSTQVVVTENAQYSNTYGYHYQTSTSRSYRFEVLDVNGFELASKDRSMTTGAQFSSTYLNKSITDLVYFNNSGQIQSGSGNKYLDVSYSSSNWTQVTDAGYDQGVHTVSTNSLYNSNSTLRTILNGLSYKMYATVYFTQKEEKDGYQYIQIYTGNAGTYDNVDDPDGGIGTLTNSLYRACFILSYSPSGSVMSDEHYQFFPHRYDYVDKATDIANGITNYEFDYDNSHLYAQKFKSTTYKANTSGSLVLSPTAENINIRFDAGGGGNDKDQWDFKDLKVRLALVDDTYPTLINTADITVSAGPYIKGNTFYISVPFSEIVNTANYSNNKKLVTSWGDATYYSGDGTNVITFKGTITANAGTTLEITSVQCNFKDLADNYYQGIGNSNYTDSFDKTFSGVTSSATYTLAATNTSFTGLADEFVLSNNGPIEPIPTTVYFYKGVVNTTNQVPLTQTADYTLSWANNTAAGNGTITATGTGSYTGSASTTFPIRWSTYTVTFHDNGSIGIPTTGTMSSQSFQYGVAQNLTANAFSRTGFTFAGWNTQPDGSGDSYSNEQAVTGLTPEDGGTVNLYVQWAVIPWEGSGDNPNDPYVIIYPSQLDLLASNVNSGINEYGGKYFKLGNDIDYQPTTDWDNASSTENNYTAIGHRSDSDNYYRFQGTFDGDNHTVSGIRIYKNGTSNPDSYQALFGLVGKSGTVKNVTISDARITGNNFAGSIVGSNGGSVINCHATNTVAITSVSGAAKNHGGIVGGSGNLGSILNCTSAATLTANTQTAPYYGAIAGRNYGLIQNCLAVGACIPAQNNNYGVITGHNDNGTLTTNYYYGCTVGNTANAINAGVGNSDGAPSDLDGARSVHSLTLADGVTATGESVTIGSNTYYASNTTVTLGYSQAVAQQITYHYNDGSDHTLTGNTFTMPATDATVSVSFTAAWSGSGTSGSPYLITTTGQLDLLAKMVNGTDGYTANGFSGKFFKLDNDIAYDPTTLDANGENYTAIGGTNNGFRGTFDGDGHTISGIRINKTGSTNADSEQGVFGRVFNGTIKNVVLSDAHITGKAQVGGIVGYPYSTSTVDCLVLNSQISATGSTNNCGVITGYYSSSTLMDNYYYNCSLTRDGNTYTTNIGAGSNSVSDCDGARSVHALTLGTDITAADETVTIGTDTYYASNTTVTLSYTVPDGYAVIYTYNDGSDHAITGNTFTMPAADVTVSATLAVPYIDADGNEQNCTDFTLLESSTGTTVILGTAGTESWYVVNGNVNITVTVTKNIELYGAVHLILMDGATLTVEGPRPISAYGSLTIYGQSLGTGRLVATAGSGSAIRVDKATTDVADNGTLTINGGNITATTSVNNAIQVLNAITINGGSVTASSSSTTGFGITSNHGDITLNGGSVNATGGSYVNGIIADGTLTLGWRNTTDRIYASSYQGRNGIVVKSGQAFTDGTNIYAGTLTTEQRNAIAGKTLQPVDALVLADNADNTSIIDAHNGETVNVMLYGRTLYKDGKWNTLCLPFNIHVGRDIMNNADSPLHGATIMMFDRSSWYNANGQEHYQHNEGDADGCHRSGQVENGNLYLYFFTAIEGNSGFYTDISAGEPFLVKWDGDGTNNIVNPVFTGVTISNGTNWMNQTTKEGSDGYTHEGNVTFIGTYAPVTLPANDKSYLFLGSSNQLHWPTADVTVNAFRAYFQLNDPNAQVKDFILNFGEGEPTLISLPKGREASDDAWYDLSGRKLNGTPKQPGLYIHGGKRVVIK